MRIRGALLVGGIIIAACGDDDGATPADCPDAGTIADAGTALDAAPPPVRAHVNSPELRTLLTGGNYLLLGVTTNFEPYAVYYQFNLDNTVDVGAVPVYGGAPVILQKAIADADNAFVSGGAVAWYTNTNDGIASAISIWTPEHGTKKLATKTVPGVFAANEDGALVAFSANAQIDATPLVVTRSAEPSLATPQLAGVNAANLLSTAIQCSISLRYFGDRLLGSFCTDGDEAKLFTVTGLGPADERGNATNLGSSEIFFFDADPLGRRAFVFTGDLKAHLLTLDGDPREAKDLGEVNDARMLDDGSGVVVLRDRMLTFIGEREVTLASDASILYGVARGSRTVFFGTTDAQATATDLKAISADGGAPITLVATPTARFIDTSGSSTHAIYRTDVLDGIGPLKAIPVGGGAEVTLAPKAFGANVSPEGTGVLAVSDASSVAGSQAFRATFAYTDAVTAAPPVEITTALLTVDTGTWVDRSFVFLDQGTSPGLFALEVP